MLAFLAPADINGLAYLAPADVPEIDLPETPPGPVGSMMLRQFRTKPLPLLRLASPQQ